MTILYKSVSEISFLHFIQFLDFVADTSLENWLLDL